MKIMNILQNQSLTLKTLSKYCDSDMQIPNKQTQTQKHANIQTEKQKDIITGRHTGRLTSGHRHVNKK